MARNSRERRTTRDQGVHKHIARTNSADFKGRQEDLEKTIFKCDKPEHAAQFTSTLKEITMYVEREYKGGETSDTFLESLKIYKW